MIYFGMGYYRAKSNENNLVYSPSTGIIRITSIPIRIQIYKNILRNSKLNNPKLRHWFSHPNTIIKVKKVKYKNDSSK